MTTNNQIEANQRNAMKGTGPKTKVGKNHAKFNARKHGIFTRELTLNGKEKTEFEALRYAFQAQFSPATPMQNAAFDLIAWALWRSKLAIRNEARRLNLILGETSDQKDVPAQGLLTSRWYAANTDDLRDAISFLADIRDDVAENGATNVKDWQEQVVRLFGVQYLSMLMDWLPESIDEIYMNEHLAQHEKLYKLPLTADSEGRHLSIKPRLQWVLAVKIIDLTLQHLDTLLRMKKLTTGDVDLGPGVVALDLASRYVTTTMRELERAIRWFLELRKQGL